MSQCDWKQGESESESGSVRGSSMRMGVNVRVCVMEGVRVEIVGSD